MKWLILTFVLAIAAGLALTSSPASAHVLKIDGSIGVVLHINPDDAPSTGSPTSYILYFSDTTGRFTLPKCDCGVAIQENGKIIYTHLLITTNPLESDDIYTFIKPDVYTIEVSGKPKEPGAFQPFVLNYLVRVTAPGGGDGVQPFPMLLWIGMGLGVGLILLGGYKSEHNG